MTTIKTSSKGYNLIKRFEGLATSAYKCPAGVLTIGYGHTGKDVVKGMVITELYADELLKADVAKLEHSLIKSLNADEIVVNQNQFDALISFSYNLGVTRLVNSTLWRYLCDGKYRMAAGQFIRWNKCNGKVLQGLTYRREAEAKLFLEGLTESYEGNARTSIEA